MKVLKYDRKYRYWSGGITLHNADKLNEAIALNFVLKRENKITKEKDYYDIENAEWRPFGKPKHNLD